MVCDLEAWIRVLDKVEYVILPSFGLFEPSPIFSYLFAVLSRSHLHFHDDGPITLLLHEQIHSLAARCGTLREDVAIRRVHGVTRQVPIEKKLQKASPKI